MKNLSLIILALVYSLTFSFSKAEDGKKFLTLGTYTYGLNHRMDNLLPFSTLIQEKLEGEYKVITVSYPTVDELIQAMLVNEVDMVFISTSGYLGYMEHSQDFEIAGALIDDSGATSSYRSVIAASKKSGISDWEGVMKKSKNLKFSFVDEKSTSGYLFPIKQLESKKLIPIEDQFKTVDFSGNHMKALESILSGESDLAAFGANDLYALGKRKDEINILWISDTIPLGPVLVSKRVEEKVKLVIEDLLLGLHFTQPTVFETVKSGWVEAQHASRFEKVSLAYYLDFLK
ncbi:phosphate/phosphite/phosphonate ABC transporter substrate-binding protein [Cecembia calidifontis]|uniref:Phosphate/phosphite/phosphonate ABC transporter binding protein n=1 Tax=Cecembia calidifontis TaxID=1187080 RepID=A0A4Q7PC45_9BACT|nr:phosphate/phosphite/phosphonate ABC transporter substrate-binding protein [Cecembia calidifontis]RZS97795.1 phosphate/phosphite/phosphonate ABC transporter binding protein [Cecembia calidifontis]